ncbi:hypothetical protein DOTSEDRAFT_47999, partial [Dothistroma septosporum NZE10]
NCQSVLHAAVSLKAPAHHGSECLPALVAIHGGIMKPKEYCFTRMAPSDRLSRAAVFECTWPRSICQQSARRN